eukprot:scaffold10295_cov116-Isochrysis_galbana.AAC.3
MAWAHDIEPWYERVGRVGSKAAHGRRIDHSVDASWMHQRCGGGTVEHTTVAMVGEPHTTCPGPHRYVVIRDWHPHPGTYPGLLEERRKRTEAL